MSRLTVLEARYDQAKSFYKKAEVFENEEERTLYSYGTEILSLIPNERITKITWTGHTMTTMRHINEFLLQNGFIKLTKDDWGLLIDAMDVLVDEVSPHLLMDLIDNKKEVKKEIKRARATTPS